MIDEKVSVNLRGLSQTQLDSAYALIKEMGSGDFILYVDERIFNSSLAPKRQFKLRKDRPPVGAVGLKDLVQMKKAIEVHQQVADLLDKENVQVETKKRGTIPVLELEFNDAL